MKKSYSRAAVAGAGVALAGSALMLLGVVAPSVLTAWFGFTSAQATGAAAAIMAGMDVATALSVFGGVTAAGGWALWLLRKAVGRQAIVK
ncbi:hypothetical protein ACH4SP_40615 [Streptomyces sp. NPDC021093]|uniref:hypothetical protein n=1 Tax=Streptomyces sp. NPDC021093 TaxID=3365112 RepID=UPI0037AE1722